MHPICSELRSPDGLVMYIPAVVFGLCQWEIWIKRLFKNAFYPQTAHCGLFSY